MVCFPTDIQCIISEAVTNMIMKYIIPIGVAVFAFFLLIIGGKKLKILGLLILLVEFLWFLGIPGFVSPLRDVIF